MKRSKEMLRKIFVLPYSFGTRAQKETHKYLFKFCLHQSANFPEEEEGHLQTVLC